MVLGRVPGHSICSIVLLAWDVSNGEQPGEGPLLKGEHAVVGYLVERFVIQYSQQRFMVSDNNGDVR